MKVEATLGAIDGKPVAPRLAGESVIFQLEWPEKFGKGKKSATVTVSLAELDLLNSVRQPK